MIYLTKNIQVRVEGVAGGWGWSLLVGGRKIYQSGSHHERSAAEAEAEMEWFGRYSAAIVEAAADFANRNP